MTENLTIIKNFVTDSFGIKIPDELLADLQRNVKFFCEEYNLDEDSFVYKIKNNSFSDEELTNFVNIITIGETHFFRDQKLFVELENKIIPDLLETKSSLHALSIGCSTGEEPYSLSILFDKISKGFLKRNLLIDSIDINKISLEKAKAGIYPEWSFRNTPKWVKDGYFNHINGSYYLNERIKESVNFSCFNLKDIDKNIISPTLYYDIIICRNIFIYFDKQTINNTLVYIYNHLNLGGIFITSPSESGYIDTSILKKYNPLNSSIFVKTNKEISSTHIKSEVVAKENRKALRSDSTISIKKPSNSQHNTVTNTLSYDDILIKGKDKYTNHQIDEAFNLFLKCNELNPLEVKPYFYMGIIKQELGEFTEAKRFLQKALFLSPKEIGVLTVYHNLLVNLNDNEHLLISKRLNAISFEDKQNYKDDLFNLV